MGENSLKSAILIVSDTAAQEPSSDKTVDVLSASFAAAGSWESPVTKIVPDNVLDIQRAICDWTDGPDWPNLVLVSGGTGFAVKDNTPEVGGPLAAVCYGNTDNRTRLYRLSFIAMHQGLCGLNKMYKKEEIGSLIKEQAWYAYSFVASDALYESPFSSLYSTTGLTRI